MPSKPKKPYRYPGCAMLTFERFCPEHQTKSNADDNRYQRDPDTYKRYGSDWKKIRYQGKTAKILEVTDLHPGSMLEADEMDGAADLYGVDMPAPNRSLCPGIHPLHPVRRSDQPNNCSFCIN